MGCSGCGAKKMKFKKLVDQKQTELAKAFNIETRQKRIEARNERIKRRNERLNGSK